MFDDGDDPLSELVAFGNLWHGGYSESGGFISRAGIRQNFLNQSDVANDHKDAPGYDAHLVDFGMPELVTSEEEAAAGMEWWNKAILYGKDKYYSILSTWGLGESGWPYRSPDGSVWHLQARITGTDILKIYGDLIRMDRTSPTIEIASFDLPLSTGTVMSLQTYDEASISSVTVNFNPKSGANAAIHQYGRYRVPMWILEVEVSQGSYEMPPTISGEFTFNEQTSVVSTEEIVNIQNPKMPMSVSFTNAIIPSPIPVGSEYAAYIKNGRFYFERPQTYTLTGRDVVPSDDPINYDPASVPGSIKSVSLIVGVVYGRDGERQVVTYKETETLTRKDSGVIIVHGGYVAYDVRLLDGGEYWIHAFEDHYDSAPIRWRREVTEVLSTKNEFLVNGVSVAVLEGVINDMGYAERDANGQNDNRYGFLGDGGVISHDGNAYNESEVRIDSFDGALNQQIRSRISMPASNVFAYCKVALPNQNPLINRVLLYAAPDNGGGVFTWPDPWDLSQYVVPIAVDPVTGSFSKSVTRYF